MPELVPSRRAADKPSPTLRELASVLFRQRRIFFGVFAVVFAVAVVYAIAFPNYAAHMKVLVRRGRADPLLTPREAAPAEFANLEITEEDLNSEVELFKDDELLRQVVRANGLAAHDTLWFLHIGENGAQRTERAARRLAKRLQAEAVKKTNLIVVTYESQDPAAGARVLRSLADLYLAKHAEVHRPSGTQRFFERQVAEARGQLEDSQRKVLQFMEQQGVVSGGEERDLALRRLSEMEADYRQNQVAIAETQHRVQTLEAQLASLPERTTTAVRSADNPQLLQTLKSRLLELKLKRTDLVTKFEPTHRLVQEVDQQIAEAESAIAAEAAAPVRDETTDKNSNYEWAKAELQQAHVSLSGLQARAAATSLQLASYRELAHRLEKGAIVQDDLLSAEKAAQDNYLLYVKKREEARMGDALDERGIVNVTIAEQPVAPALPVWSAGMVCLVGLVLAGILGMAAAFTKDFLDPAFRTPEEVIACLEMPVLASLPRHTNSSWLGGNGTTQSSLETWPRSRAGSDW